MIRLPSVQQFKGEGSSYSNEEQDFHHSKEVVQVGFFFLSKRRLVVNPTTHLKVDSNIEMKGIIRMWKKISQK